MKLSVLVVAVCLRVATCRRLNDQIDTNEVDLAPSNDVATTRTADWVKINQSPYPVINAPLGARVELECEAIGSPTPVMQWLKGHQPLTENESYDTNSISDTIPKGLAKVKSRLVINHAHPIHQGTFTCVAESGSQVATAQTKVHVGRKTDHEKNFTSFLAKQIVGSYHVPRIVLWTAMLMDVLGSDVILPCQTVGNPKPDLVWLDQTGAMVDNRDERVSVLPDGALRIRSILWDDMGMYTCVSKNSLGEDRVESFLYPLKESK